MPADDGGGGSTDDPAAAGDDGPAPGGHHDAPGDPWDEGVAAVEAAAKAAEGLVFSRYARSEVDDLDVRVRFAEGVLEVDVYLDAPDDPDPERVADDAAMAARAAADDVLEG